MAQNQQSQNGGNQTDLQRAVIIGLGGTGAEVLGRLRRLIVDRFGSFEALPIVKFLYLDTDPTWIQNSPLGIEEDIRMSQSEIVDLQVADASGLYSGITDGNYPNYDWFTIEKLRSFPNITKGAGTIRQLGRLCFWQHQTEIANKLRALVQSVNAASNATFMQDQYGQTVSPGLNIHIIAGLAGGTGSGCALDMAYLTRQIVEQIGVQGAHQYAGYLVLPSAFKSLPGTNALPNGYAALKELNYLNYRFAPDNLMAPLFGEPQWHVELTPDGYNPVKATNQAPFDFCYLLDSSNANVQLSRQDIFAMVARSLFQEFTSEFAAFKRSLRANIRNRMTSNDPLDCPAQFMSFGQSSVLLPRREIKQILAHQLALRAVQGWVNQAAKPIQILATANNDSKNSEEDIANSLTASLVQSAESEEVMGAVRGHLVGEFLPNNGFRASDVLTSVVADDRTRLVDVPYQLKENEKQRWISEDWKRDAFKGRLSAAWERWRRDFGDDGADPTTWGEQIRWMVANQERATSLYRSLIYDHAMQLFHNPNRGPAWALSFVNQMSGPLTTLKTRFLQEANDANAVANALGDLVLINAASQGQGPSLSAIIEGRIGQEYQELDRLVSENRMLSMFGGEERVRAQAETYLKFCAHWCRARVEERSRRLASEMCGTLLDALDDYDSQIRHTASSLAKLQARVLGQAQQWAQKGATTENVGELLYDPALVEVLERKVKELRGDAYDPRIVGEKALKQMNISLDKLGESDVDQLSQILIGISEDVLGDLSESQQTRTHFAVYDLLVAQCRDQNQLDTKLRDTSNKGAPFVQLSTTPPGGPWQPASGLLETKGAGIRGGYQPSDQDPERVKVVESLVRLGWNPSNEVKSIGDSEQIVFVQECGGFPLRAIAGIAEMKQAYDNHRKMPQNGPLHIVRDEMAARYPDVFPPNPKDLERALALQSIGLALGLIAPHNFPNPNGTTEPMTLYAYKSVTALGSERFAALGDTPAAVGMKLAFDVALAKEIESALHDRVSAADAEERADTIEQIKTHLGKLKQKLATEMPAITPTTNPVYIAEEDRMAKFLNQMGLS